MFIVGITSSPHPIVQFVPGRGVGCELFSFVMWRVTAQFDLRKATEHCTPTQHSKAYHPTWTTDTLTKPRLCLNSKGIYETSIRRVFETSLHNMEHVFLSSRKLRYYVSCFFFTAPLFYIKLMHNLFLIIDSALYLPILVFYNVIMVFLLVFFYGFFVDLL